MKYENVSFVSSQQPEALDGAERLKARYPNVPPDEADVIVALGGDGFMLRAVHEFINRKAPIFGMNRHLGIGRQSKGPGIGITRSNGGHQIFVPLQPSDIRKQARLTGNHQGTL